MESNFWLELDKLIAEREIVIDRAKDSVHPRYSGYVYPFDYGYLKDTYSSDGSGIDIWLGSGARKKVTALIVTLDAVKPDMEPKVLIDCTLDDANRILACHQRGSMVAHLIIRDGK